MSATHLLIIAALGLSGLLVGVALGLAHRYNQRRTTAPEEPSIPAADMERYKQVEEDALRKHRRWLKDHWHRLKVKDLKVGEVYRDRLSLNRVKVVRTRLFDPEKQRHLRDTADCTMWNAAKGCYQDVHLYDGDLETDNPMLDASEERRIARVGP